MLSNFLSKPRQLLTMMFQARNITYFAIKVARPSPKCILSRHIRLRKSHRCMATGNDINFKLNNLSNGLTSQAVKKLTRRRPKKLEENTSSNNWNVIAYAVAEELDFANLIVGLNKQGLYQSAVLPDDVDNGLHMIAKYPVDNEPREVYIYREGTAVFWNFPEIERLSVLRFLRNYGENSYDDDVVHNEREVLEYCYNSSDTRLVRGKIMLNTESQSDLEKYSFSDALSLSVKLAVWERTLDQFVESIETITEDLKYGRKIKLTRDQVLRKMGELFTLRHHLNLSSDLLDTPDFYWERENLEPFYKKTTHYLNVDKRTKVMNEKMNHCHELVQLLSDHLTDVHHVRLEVMIIALITIEILTYYPVIMTCRLLTRNNIKAFIDSFDHILTDCDGVLWNGDKAIAGSPETLSKLRKLGKRVFYVTNNSTETRDSYVNKCGRLGFQATLDEICCTANIVATHLHHLNFAKAAYVIGSPGLCKELDLVGIKHFGTGPDIVTSELRDWIINGIDLEPNVGAVIVGLDKEFNYIKMLKAASYLKDPECIFIATNTDDRFPVENSNIVVPGTGCIVAAVKTAAGREPIVLGKPNPGMFDALAAQHGLDPKRCLMVGDRLETDILLGTHCGLKTLLVLTGVATLADVENHQSSNDVERKKLIPDYYIQNLGDIAKMLDDK